MRQITLNGKPLPELFRGGSIVSDIIITRDGSHYAHVHNDELTIAEVPQDNIIKAGPHTILYEPKQPFAKIGELRTQGHLFPYTIDVHADRIDVQFSELETGVINYH